jgi:diguanylate cyclase (GGDEF)-like protein/PAS domain S-box-containing protein
MMIRPEQYKAILDNLSEGVYFVDRARVVTYWNTAAERLTGYAAKEVVGRACFDNILAHMDERGTNLCTSGCPLHATILDGQTREMEVYLHHRDGHRVPVVVRAAPLRDEAGNILGAVETFSSNTAKVAALDRIRELEQVALLDPLTGVGNRRYADASLEARLASMHRLGWPLGLLLIDIDAFKSVNDTHGHKVGDEVLRMVASTVSGTVRSYDEVARWGGEEFVILCPGLDRNGLHAMGERLRTLVEGSGLRLHDGAVRVTISVGAALARGEDTPASLIERLDRALYASKREGRNRVTFLD